MEVLDIFNGKGEFIGTKNRDDVHRDGDWHKTIHCWIIYEQEGIGYVILQKRSDNKKSWPGYVDISAAGHLLSGETIQDGIREIEEELGINVDFKNLIDGGIRVCVEEFKDGIINHEFQNIFFLINDLKLDEYKIQDEELSGLLTVQIDLLLQLFSGEIDKVEATGFIIDSNGNKISFVYEIDKTKFIPTLDNYYFRSMILAKQVINKEKYLHI